ncbi:MAG: caspase family protein [Phormidesmis sp.]
MANYWAITIGINQYRHLQPLMHAQNDALFTHRFLTEEADIPADHCVLLSDLTTSVGEQAVYPDKPAIAEWMQTIIQQVGPDDVLWFFFSGYGAQLNGADYLMPIDGDPEQIEETGMAAADLIVSLAQLPSERVLLILDINRSQGSLAGQEISQQVIDLAQKHGVATLLSCQPEQYSHETLGTRHGLFTAALLEALRQGTTTVGGISDYLSQRLPEICEHHWRPIQNPVSLLSDQQRLAVVVPQTHSTTEVAAARFDEANGLDSADSRETLAGGSSQTTSTLPAIEPATRPKTEPAIAASSKALAIAPPIPPSQSLYPTETESAGSDRPTDYASNSSSGSNVDGPNSSAIVPYQPVSTEVNGARLRNWGLLALAILMGGVLLKQPFVKAAWQDLSERVGLATAVGSNEVENAADPIAGEAAVIEPLIAESGEVPEELAAVPESAEAPLATPATEAEETTDDEPVQPEESAAVDRAAEQAKAKALIDEANAAIAQNQYSEALIALQQVPQTERDTTFSSALTRARAGAAAAQQANASVLTEAQTFIQPAQASQFTQAIAKARPIRPGQPSYEEAQESIRTWSRTILDIAEGRATSGNLDEAIAAARVMPRDNDEFYQKAQKRIEFWQQRQASRDIIQVAQTIPKSGQASTYQQGIVKLREVPIEHPEYDRAQRLADEWSQRIFSIAQARAAQGRQSAAIQAAILVPAGTTAYEPTQQAIRRWQAEELSE